ncbi:hypothetical protein R6Z07M_016375 [Ovis aries]
METSTSAKDHDVATEYDYGDQILHDPVEERAFGAQLLPPLYSVVFVIGLIGNILVILVLMQYKKLRKISFRRGWQPAGELLSGKSYGWRISNIYLLNLAISDLIFLFTLPFWIDYKVKDDWIFGDAMCKLLSGFYFLGLYSEIFFIVLLTIDRYLAIVHAVFALQAWTVTFGTVTSIVTWVLAILASVPGLYFSKTQWWFTHYTCSLHFPPESHGRKWKQFLALKLNILGLILPLLVMIVCYTGIIKILLRTWSENKANMTWLIFVIMITFFLFWTPYDLTVFVSAFQDSLCEHCSQLDLAIEVTEAIAYVHCCINPLVYVFFCRGPLKPELLTLAEASYHARRILKHLHGGHLCPGTRASVQQPCEQSCLGKQSPQPQSCLQMTAAPKDILTSFHETLRAETTSVSRKSVPRGPRAGFSSATEEAAAATKATMKLASQFQLSSGFPVPLGAARTRRGWAASTCLPSQPLPPFPPSLPPSQQGQSKKFCFGKSKGKKTPH